MSENSPVGETTANQVEDIIEQDNSSLVHAKSYLLVVVCDHSLTRLYGWLTVIYRLSI